MIGNEQEGETKNDKEWKGKSREIVIKRVLESHWIIVISDHLHQMICVTYGTYLIRSKIFTSTVLPLLVALGDGLPELVRATLLTSPTLSSVGVSLSSRVAQQSTAHS